ncbi:Beta-glucuronidase, partial [Armadillidium nasatum]
YIYIQYINGVELTSHEVGHLPFDAEISDYVFSDSANWITICINNTLTPLSIPQGEVVYHNDPSKYPPGYFTLDYSFDFFNYAGIHRPVFLYTTPQTHIDDITILTNIQDGSGIVDYTISVNNPDSLSNCSVEIYDESDVIIESSNSCQGEITIGEPNLWWPYLMSDDPGYQYTLRAYVTDSEGTVDVYPQKFGIRTIAWNSTTVTLNGKALYLRGFGKHEDFDIIGKGVSYPLIVKDFSLLKWVGANSFRTSHYPYAEEIMDMADEEGIMVIDESPAVNLEDFGNDLLEKHKSIQAALYRRDKNRPSVIMWSVANEPRSQQAPAGPYFGNLTDYVRSLDSTRPVTAAISQSLSSDLASKSLDVIMLNRYYAWYSDTGHLNDPPFTWSEEYQGRLMIENFKAFDTLRESGFFFGEMIWNFADFMTVQGTNRVGGNRKGVFTRERQPKLSAHLLRERYLSLANQTSDSSLLWTKILA